MQKLSINSKEIKMKQKNHIKQSPANVKYENLYWNGNGFRYRAEYHIQILLIFVNNNIVFFFFFKMFGNIANFSPMPIWIRFIFAFRFFIVISFISGVIILFLHTAYNKIYKKKDIDVCEF